MLERMLRGMAIAGVAACVAATAVRGQNGASVPEWMAIDHDARTVNIEIVAGATGANNNWNLNGYTNGEATIVVPAGYTVTLSFRNNDPVMVHSLGVGPKATTWPPMFEAPIPVFDGAMTANPTDMTNATRSGANETLTFVADTPGEYALICYVPAHAVTGMWLGFTVSADGHAGLQTG